MPATKRIHKSWIKLHIRLLYNADIAELPDSNKWRFVECLLMAGEERNRALEEGIDQEDGFLPSLKHMAFTLRVTQAALKDDLSRLAMAGLVELQDTENGERWFVTNFNKWQSGKDSNPGSAERQRFSRARRKNQESEEEQEEDKRIRIRIIDDTKVSQSCHNNVTGESETGEPLTVLEDYFHQKTLVFPGGNYETNWREPLTAILQHVGGNVEWAKRLIDESLDVARAGDKNGNPYRITSPRSIANIAGNLARQKKATENGVNAGQLWQKAMNIVASGKADIDDPALAAAIKKVGWQTIQAAGERNADELQRRLANEYRNATPA